MKPTDNQPASGVLRTAALIALAMGAIGTIVFMLRVGRNQPVLNVLFAGWDLAPFVALGIADKRSTRWPAATRATLYVVMLIVAVASFAIYGYVALGPRRSQPAAPFLMVPVASWLLMAVAVPIAAFVSRRSG